LDSHKLSKVAERDENYFYSFSFDRRNAKENSFLVLEILNSVCEVIHIDFIGFAEDRNIKLSNNLVGAESLLMTLLLAREISLLADAVDIQLQCVGAKGLLSFASLIASVDLLIG
jgi:hypothetical protein